jgi:predicted glycoside hydrolase/deacetylase ChbG (UPF0249 family)
MKPRTIIVNADDLGLSPSVNTAIFNVFKAGNLSSATLMVNMPGTQDAVDRLPQHAGLAVGLHFCITEGFALSGPSALTDEQGRFRDRGTLFRMVLKGRIPTSAIQHEFEAQWDRAVALGVVPDHLDSHQHTLMIPQVLDAVLEQIHQRKLPTRIVHPPLRTITSDLSRPARALKQVLNRSFAWYAHHRLKVPVNTALVSVHDLESAGPYDARTFAELMARADDDAVLEVMVHPYILGADVLGIYADVMDTKGPFLQRCQAEYQALMLPDVFAGCTLGTFHAIGR